MLRTRKNPVREWFNTMAGSILAAGLIGLIAPSASVLFTYILGFLGFSAVVFGVSGFFQPHKDAGHAFVGSTFILLLLICGSKFGII